MGESEVLRQRIADLEKKLSKEQDKVKCIEASQNMLAVLRRVQSQFILEAEPAVIFNRMLSDLLELTDSEYGFIGEVIEGDGGVRYLKTRAITNIAWNEEMVRFYWENAPEGMVFKNLNTLFGAVLKSGQDVISNHPPGDPRSGGLPEGHPDLNSFLGIPIYHRDKLVGMIGIANRPDGYDEELVAFIEPFVNTCASMIESLRNETLRREAEEALRRGETKLKAVFDGIIEPLIMVDGNMRISMLNQAAIKYYETKAIDCIGETCFGIFKQRSKPCEGCRLPEALASGEPMDFERRGLTNPALAERVSIYPLRRNGNSDSGAVMRISDITRKKEIERQMMRADRLSSLGQLSGGIAHEIRNPLSGINLFVDILSDDQKFERSDQELEMLQEIKDGIRKISSIITGILSLSKAEKAGETDLDVNKLINETIRLWYAHLRDSGVELKLSLAPDLHPVYGEAISIQQVLNNLIQNGIDAMGREGELKVTTYEGMSSFHPDRTVVFIRIKDQGKGIPDCNREKIFDPFFTTKSMGTGLGLSISHQIIENHGGIISCESEPGRGATFTIELPSYPES